MLIFIKVLALPIAVCHQLHAVHHVLCSRCALKRIFGCVSYLRNRLLVGGAADSGHIARDNFLLPGWAVLHSSHASTLVHMQARCHNGCMCVSFGEGFYQHVAPG